jgi:predicted polyphosphate/ATP-dependent NAD kinase
VARVGLIVNPIAGMGGRVGLKGTDSAAALARARELGATPLAAERTVRALERLERCDGLVLVTAPGAMGAEVAAGRGFKTEVLPRRPLHGDGTSADDTRAAAEELARRDVDLILFAGGDGTTRDIIDVVGDRVHSAVFATTPENAGDVAAAFVSAGRRAPVREADVVDVDEEAVRAGTISTRLYGAARVPDDRLRVQALKAGSTQSDEQELESVCRHLAEEMDPRRLYLLGPGTTTRRVMRHLGLPKTLLGVDVVCGGRLLAADVGERRLLDLLGGESATLIVGVVGGQGALFGRGNQQLSPAVLRRIGTDNIEIVAGSRKLLALDPPLLRVDTGDPELDATLAGYRRVHVAPRRTLVCKVAA